MQIDQSKLINEFAGKTVENGQGILAYMDKEQKQEPVVYAEGYEKSRGTSAVGSISMTDATYMKPQRAEEKKQIAEQLAAESGVSALDRRNEMAVLANTMTPEDLAKMEEDGFSLSDMRGSAIVTVTDKIKVEMAKGGADMSFAGPMSEQELQEITGSAAVASQIADVFQANDIPMTTDNLEDAQNALNEANAIDELKDSAIRYLVKNELPPTIENVYRAQHSYVEVSDAKQINPISDQEFEKLKDQISQVITDSGFPMNQEIIADSRYLIENNIPLTPENFMYYEDLKNASFEDIDPKQLLSAMAEAVAEGNRPLNAMMLKGYSLWEKANDAVDVLENASEEDLSDLIENEKELTVQNLKVAVANRKKAQNEVDPVQLISAKRQLEEARLMMTAQANYTLLKKGISIDTKPLVDLVEDLKLQENSYYKELLENSQIDATQERVSIFANTTQILSDLKEYPADIIAKIDDEETLVSLHQKGEIAKNTYEKANERYEALWTAPRADMGDSWKKAFSNVDDILTDLGFDTTDANRRAVRILAYNSIDITEENINQVKWKDEEVSRVFSSLTPKVTLEMIRKGINPLDLELSELSQAVDEIANEFSENDSERFEKYLWKLEQNKKISEEERSAYIGIYRLIAQVEKTDGAVIGSLIHQGTEITMRNLLMAVRSEKKNMDYAVDDSFDGVSKKDAGVKIDEQIMVAYHNNCIKDSIENLTPEAAKKLADNWMDLTPEQLKEEIEQTKQIDKTYYKEQLEEFANVLEASDDIYTYLEQNNIEGTMSNIAAMTQMLRNPNRMFNRLFSDYTKDHSAMEMVQDIKEEILERFAEAIKSPEEMAQAQEALADVAEHVMDTMIIEGEDVRAVDLKELRLLNKQLSLCAKQAKQECYMIPMETSEGGVTGVSLKIVRGEEKKGLVDILFRGDLMGKVAASFEAKENGISGMIATDDEQTRQLLADHLGLLAEKLSEGQNEQVDLRVAYTENLSLEHYAISHAPGTTENGTQSNPVQTARLYHIAESFIEMIQEFDQL